MTKSRYKVFNRAPTVRDWTQKRKEEYFKEYLKHKKRMRKWHKLPKAQKGIDLYQQRSMRLDKGIWEGIVEYQFNK